MERQVKLKGLRNAKLPNAMWNDDRYTGTHTYIYKHKIIHEHKKYLHMQKKLWIASRSLMLASW